MIPLAVDIAVASPVVYGDFPIHLDALLMRAAAIRERGRAAMGYRSGGGDTPDPHIPIATGPMGVYRASGAIFVDPLYSTVAMTVRSPAPLDRWLGHARAQLQLTRGPYRQAMALLPAAFSKFVRFYAVGDPDAVKEMLEAVAGIGKRTGSGFGEIRKFVVRKRPDGPDYSWAIDGRPVRVLPIETAPNGLVTKPGRVGTATYRPPYWDRRAGRTTLCFIPQSPIVFNEEALP